LKVFDLIRFEIPRYSWLKPLNADSALASSILDNTVNNVVRSTSVPTAERFSAPLMKSPSQCLVHRNL
jgi:hypothetical protein